MLKAMAWLRKLWARLVAWVRRQRKRVLRGRAEQEAPANVLPKRLMHWSPGVDGLPLCGASTRELWTIEFDYANCGVCLSTGRLQKLLYDVSTR